MSATPTIVDLPPPPSGTTGTRGNTSSNGAGSLPTHRQQPDGQSRGLGGGNSGSGSGSASGPPIDPSQTVARLSSPWTTDDTYSHCSSCSEQFNQLNRRHHCRLCGRIFCNRCSSNRSLIPPSSIVLVPHGGRKVDSEARARRDGTQGFVGFEREVDPDRMVTYMKSPDEAAGGAGAGAGAGGGAADSTMAAAEAADHTGTIPPSTPQAPDPVAEDDTLLYGRGLEERAKLAREPLRVCDSCHSALQSVQEELRLTNANAMRFNSIDPTDLRRLFNSPLAFTLGHEVRKAAYTLNNLLPLPKRLGALTVTSQGLGGDPLAFGGGGGGSISGISGNPYAITSAETTEQCRDTCTAVGGNLGNLDGVRIPARLMQKAKGLAVMTVIKGGFGLVGVEFGTGLVVARLGDGRGWSPPSAIGMGGIAGGALIGAQVSDHVFLLMNDDAVNLFASNDGSFQLGADVGVAVGPLGRAAEADFGATGSSGSGGFAMAPIYTYSLSKGLYAGLSVDGKVIVTRHDVNERFYGQQITAKELLMGEIPTPPAAQPLYDALKRCHVYASTDASAGGTARNSSSSEHFVREMAGFEESQGNFTLNY